MLPKKSFNFSRQLPSQIQNTSLSPIIWIITVILGIRTFLALLQLPVKPIIFIPKKGFMTPKKMYPIFFVSHISNTMTDSLKATACIMIEIGNLPQLPEM